MTSANPAVTHTPKNKALNPLLKDKIKHMQNKKPHRHSMSEQQADISWRSRCAVNKSILLSITNLHNYRKFSKNLKLFFPFSYTTCCASPVDMTREWPHSPLLSQCYTVTYSKPPFTVKPYDSLPLSWIYLQPSLVCYLVLLPWTTYLRTHRTLSTCSHFAFIFHAHVHQTW